MEGFAAHTDLLDSDDVIFAVSVKTKGIPTSHTLLENGLSTDFRLSLLKEYQKLGTLGELTDVVERQKPKNPIIKPWSPAICPSCGTELSESIGDGYYKHYTHLERCTNPKCAQRLNWPGKF